MNGLKGFLRSAGAIAFAAYTLFYSSLAAFVWWGAWSTSRSMVQPDHAMVFSPSHAANFLRRVLSGGAFVPFDLHWFLGSPYWWAELEYAIPCWVAGLAVCFYLRGRSASRLAGYGAGLCFALSGYTLTLFSAGHMGCFELVTYAIFAFGLIDRALSAPRPPAPGVTPLFARCVRLIDWALLGAVVAWAAARQADLWMLFTALAAAYGVWCLVREARSAHRRERPPLPPLRIVAGIALALVCAAAIGAPQFRRAISADIVDRERQLESASAGAQGEAAKERERWLFVTNWSMPPEDVLEFAAAEVRGGSSDRRVSPRTPYWGRLGRPDDSKFVKGKVMPNYRQHSLYLGAVTVSLALAALALLLRGRRREESVDARALFADVPFWACAAVVCLVLSMGRYTPFYALVYKLPFVGSMRAPVKFHHLTELCVAMLAGYGVEALRRNVFAVGTRRVVLALPAALAATLAAVAVWSAGDAGAIAAEISSLGFGAAGADLAATMPAACWRGCALAALACGVVLFAVRRGAGRAATAALALLLAVNAVDLAMVGHRYLAPQDISFQRAPNPIAADILAAGGGRYTVLIPGATPVVDSLVANGVDGAVDPGDRTARFAVASRQSLGDAGLSAFLKSRNARRVGLYAATARGFVRVAAEAQAQLELFEFPGAPAPDAPPPLSPVSCASAAFTLMMLALAVWRAVELNRSASPSV